MPPQPTRNPLAWPLGWPRAPERKPSRFTSHGRDITISAALSRLELELDRLGATEPLLSTNLKLSLSGVPYSGQAEPTDCGVAIYFKLKGHDRVLACDRYTSASGNIAAIASHIDALRRIERYGVGSIEQAFAGYAALPPPGEDNRPAWRSVLRFEPNDQITVDIVQARYRALAKARSNENRGLLDLNLARDAAVMELRGAGQ
jgi:hypothetical protein